MNPKIPKLRDEISRNREKIAALQSRNRDLEKQLRELENLDIVGMVRAQGMTLEQFTELFGQRTAPFPIPNKEEVTENDEEM